MSYSESVMATVKQLEYEVVNLKQELAEVRAILTTCLSDPEGEYRPAFVRRVRRLLQKTSCCKSTARKRFLA